MSQLESGCPAMSCLELTSQRGQTMAEYALVVATVVALLTVLFQNSGAIIGLLVNRVEPLL